MSMKWNNKVDQPTREKIELLYRQFDKFIEDSHSANSPEDQLLLRQWNNFKIVIEKNPTDFENMHAFINQMSDEDIKDTKSVRSTSPAPVTPKNEGKIDLNRAKLKKMSNDFLATINKNNREMFKV